MNEEIVQDDVAKRVVNTTKIERREREPKWMGESPRRTSLSVLSDVIEARLLPVEISPDA